MLLVLLGGGALLLAAAVDLVAVAGRNAGFPLRGSIELVEAAVLVFGSMSMVVATMTGAHASIRLLTDRLSPTARRVLDTFALALSALFFAAVFAGSAWIALELWRGYEHSELLRIPYRPLRLLSLACLGAVAGLFVARMFGRGGR